MVVKENGGWDVWCIRELSFYDVTGTRIATDPSAGSAETEYDATRRAGKAFDEQTHANTGEYCSREDVKIGWLEYDFTRPTEVSSYRIYPVKKDGKTFIEFSPVAWLFEGSADGTVWTTLDTQSGHKNNWGTADYKTFTFGGLAWGRTAFGVVLVTFVSVSVHVQPSYRPSLLGRIRLISGGCRVW